MTDVILKWGARVFPNIEAEQARRGHSDECVAERLGITGRAYRARKESGTFRLAEVVMLAGMYGRSMNYLLAGQADGTGLGNIGTISENKISAYSYTLN